MSILIDKKTKVICQGTSAPANAVAVRVDGAIVLPHSFAHPAFSLREMTS